MGMDLRRDWDTDVQLVAETGAALTMPHVVPARTSRAAKLLVVAAASGLTLGWIAFLCSLIARLARFVENRNPQHLSQSDARSADYDSVIVRSVLSRFAGLTARAASWAITCRSGNRSRGPH